MYKYLLGVIVLCIPVLCLADARIVYAYAGGDRASDTSVLSVKDGKVLMQAGAGEGAVLFDASTGALTILDHGGKTYMRMDDATMNEMQKQMKAAMAQMEKHMAGMSEEQREMMKKFMPDNGAQASRAPSFSVDEAGGSTEVSGFECRPVIIMKDGVPQQDACLASAGDLGISRTDYDTLAQMFEKMQTMSDRFTGPGAAMPSPTAIGGLPIRTRDHHSGSTGTLQSVETGSIAVKLFEIPADYKASSMPGS